ncbi:flavin reductase family protein [Amycolatopsis pithecellobii]|uniref:Oxidoreductase n=1 Tax=Amycolatopsis pithecellobii TaxID=664692 RepID=A0A6N7YU73_9PSEU|nr:flavin reductase family protein [Amycolatopsis pithecellobii]MTD55478.1 oxidoreductase [Amycolatopsis pithecellobii]
MTEVDSGDLTAEVLRHAYGMFPSGVTALCARVDGKPVGLAASSFTSVSLDPPLVSVCVAHTSTTWPVLRGAPRVGISVLAEEHTEIARDLAAKAGDRFARVEWTAGVGDPVFIQGATLWLDCVVNRAVAAGDHDIVLFDVHEVTPNPDVQPIVFHGSRFRQLVPTGLDQ